MFNKIPEQIIIWIILCVVMWMNTFPPVGSISHKYYPRSIMIDCNIYYSKHCRVYFGKYLDKHEDAPPTNTMDERSQGAI